MNIHKATLPQPLYSCAVDSCMEEFSFPARDLFWFCGHPEIDAEPGFYCETCHTDFLESHHFDLDEKCYSLSLEMRRREIADLYDDEDLSHEAVEEMIKATRKDQRIRGNPKGLTQNDV